MQTLVGSLAYALDDDRQNEPKVHVHGASGVKLPLDHPVNIKIRVLDGPDFQLEAHRGFVVVLNFFATWCPPCRSEAADFVAFATKHAGEAVVVSIEVVRTAPHERKSPMAARTARHPEWNRAAMLTPAYLPMERRSPGRAAFPHQRPDYRVKRYAVSIRFQARRTS